MPYPCCCENPCQFCEEDTTPRQYQVEFSGVLDSDCTLCDDFNAVFILSQVAPCRWRLSSGVPCEDEMGDANLSHIELEFHRVMGLVTTTVRVLNDGEGSEAWLAVSDPINDPQDCSQVFSGFIYDAIQSSGDGCDFTAATVTVTPI